MSELITLAAPKSEHERALEKNRLDKIGEHAYRRFVGHEQELLDAEEEIGAYIDSWDIWKKAEVEDLYETIEGPALPKNLSACVIVPVAAGQETDSLRTSLQQYAKQDADPSTWALYLHVNYTESSGNITPDRLDETDAIIDEFIAANPQLTVKVTRDIYFGEAPPIGKIRSDPWNVAMYDIQQSGLVHDNLIGISHDADTAWISPNYISEMQRAAREHPEADFIACKLSWQKVGNRNSDANKVLRYWEYLWSIQLHRHGERATYDGNTAIRMSSYAAIGGYSPTDPKLETYNLRERMSIARNHRHFERFKHVHYLKSIRLKTDSRRIYQAIAKGILPDNAWYDMPFFTGEDPVRLANTVALADQAISQAWLHEIINESESIHFSQLPYSTRERLQKIGRKIVGLPTFEETKTPE